MVHENEKEETVHDENGETVHDENGETVHDENGEPVGMYDTVQTAKQ